MSKPQMIATSVRLERLELKRVKERTERLFAALEESMDSDSNLDFESFTPAMDIFECSDKVVATLELPGIEQGDLTVSVTSEYVFIEGQKKHSGTRAEIGSSHYCCERAYGKFRRRIQLRWAINVGEVSALLRGGVLTITMPKLADRRGKTVRIPISYEE